ncbi:MAG: N-acetylglucosamine kinase [Turicibacter sp.]
MYYMGIDGGGTKTRYMIADEHLNILKDLTGETIHIHQTGAHEFKNRLASTIDQVCSEIGITKHQLTFTFFGVPGYGESQEDQELIDQLIAEIMGDLTYAVDNDGVVGWAGGTGCQPGINLVAGTGSIAIGRNNSGQVARCGGWGPIIGDDASAHAIGIKVINEYTLQKDGRHEKTCLLDLVEEHFNITYHYEMVDIIFNRIKLSRTELASYSKLASIAASKGCTRSQQIFNDAAEQLALHVKALSSALGLSDKFIVSYTGGVFNAGDLILNPLAQALQDLNCEMVAPRLQPCHGAVLLAYNLAGHYVSDQHINVLEKQA